jgi:uncharacterized tellurite resistance protein B-like protein
MPEPDAPPESEESQRLDRWLWCARVFKTRSLAAHFVSGKGVRVTRAGRTQRVDKPSFHVRIGDTVTLSRGRELWSAAVTGMMPRRGSPKDAARLYLRYEPDGTAASEEGRTPMLSNLFAKFKADDTADTEDALPAAFAALLVEAARADEDYTDHEKELIDRILTRQFDLHADAAAALRAEAEAAQAAANDLYGFTRVIKQELPREGKLQLIEDMWVIALSDESKEPYEEMIIRRLIGLIHLEDTDSTQARARAAARLNVAG